MIYKPKTHLQFLFSILLFCAFCVSCDEDFEEPKYTVLQIQDNIEIREYPSIIIAEVKMTGERKKAMNESFRVLFKYITGKNTTEQKIEMTVPVFQQKTADEEWSMSFIMPEKWDLKKLPQPQNDEVTIKQLKQQKMAVIHFSGRGSEANFSKHQSILEKHLSDNKIAYNPDQAIYAYYNSPWTPWFMRRQEVLFVISE